MKRITLYLLGLVLISSSCQKDGEVSSEEIPDINYPQTIIFEDSLSAYSIFDGTPSDLVQSSDFHLLELSSILFTDHAHKQRLVKIPVGTQMERLTDGSINYPDGTILTKTFFYYFDEGNPSLGKRILETRLLIKEAGIWNAATYIWNQAQTDAKLELNGLDTEVSWVSSNGSNQSTNYHIPTENECIACHQHNSAMTPLGPTLQNLNRTVVRNGVNINQISHLQSLGILNSFDVTQVSQIVDYNDASASLKNRARAYLSINCAHCHRPGGWDKATEKEFDFRHETPLELTGILHEKDKILNALNDGEMPFIGTTLLDQDGINIITDYLESL